MNFISFYICRLICDALVYFYFSNIFYIFLSDVAPRKTKSPYARTTANSASRATKSKRVKSGAKPVPAVQDGGSTVTEPEVVVDKVLTGTSLPSSTLTPAVTQPGKGKSHIALNPSRRCLTCGAKWTFCRTGPKNI